MWTLLLSPNIMISSKAGCSKWVTNDGDLGSPGATSVPRAPQLLTKHSQHRAQHAPNLGAQPQFSLWVSTGDRPQHMLQVSISLRKNTGGERKDAYVSLWAGLG